MERTTRGERSDSIIIGPAAEGDSKEWFKIQASNLNVSRRLSRSIVLETSRAVSYGTDTSGTRQTNPDRETTAVSSLTPPHPSKLWIPSLTT